MDSYWISNAVRNGSFIAFTVVIAMALGSVAQAAGPLALFPARLELQSLLPPHGEGAPGGFVIYGESNSDSVGRSLYSAGDINGDGFPDLVIGAPQTDSCGINFWVGAVYVIFGGRNLRSISEFDLLQLDGTNGFVVCGIDYLDRAGQSVSAAGDINGDGFDDLFIDAPGVGATDSVNYTSTRHGACYVIFGGTSIAPTGVLELETLDGSNGFSMEGQDARAGRRVGGAVAIGDVNDDGVDDFAVNVRGLEPDGSGGFVVVFGGADLGSTGSINLYAEDRPAGFVMYADPELGATSVQSAGDVNADGVGDILVGASGARREILVGSAYYGASQVVFGRPEIGSSGSLDLASLDGTNGFSMLGVDVHHRFGGRASAVGDVNGDGIGDIIMLAPHSSWSELARSFVVFGCADIGEAGTVEIDSLDGTNGFVIGGIRMRYSAAVSGAGDVNDDGYDDIVIGSLDAERGGTDTNEGETYVIFGGSEASMTGQLDVRNLDGINGLVLGYSGYGDNSGWAVSGQGDFNSDGVADLVVGVPNGDPPSRVGAGEVYVVFGRTAQPCIADITTVGSNPGEPGFSVPDGAVTVADITTFVESLLENNLDIGDITTEGAALGGAGYGVPDGLLTLTDLTVFIDAWLAGCP